MSAEDALYSILLEQIESDTLLLPTLPEIAIRVREVADDPDANIQQISNEISRDPALSLRLVRLANTSHYARAAKITSLNAAVSRIGLQSIKNIAIAMALEQLFICQNPIVKNYMTKQWHQSIKMSCVSSTLLSLYKGSEKQRLTHDVMALMGLVHNIGVLPILTEADRYGDAFANPKFLDKAMASLSSRIGEKLVQAWNFGEEFQRTIGNWSDMNFQPENVDYTDFLRLGAIYVKIRPFTDEPEQELNSLLEKGAISDIEIFHSEEFRDSYQEAKAVFE